MIVALNPECRCQIALRSGCLEFSSPLLSIACDCLILRCCSHPRSQLSLVRCHDHRPTFCMRLAAGLVVVLNFAACDLVLLAVVACLRSQLHWPCSYEFRHDGLRCPRSTLRSRPQGRCRIVLAPQLPDLPPSFQLRDFCHVSSNCAAVTAVLLISFSLLGS